MLQTLMIKTNDRNKCDKVTLCINCKEVHFPTNPACPIYSMNRRRKQICGEKNISSHEVKVKHFFKECNQLDAHLINMNSEKNSPLSEKRREAEKGLSYYRNHRLWKSKIEILLLLEQNPTMKSSLLSQSCS